MLDLAAPDAPPAENLRWIPGGTFQMGSEDFYPEERPIRSVTVEGFWMDEHPVTAAEFRRFVRETKYVTVAERPLDAADYPGADPELLVPGSLVFRGTKGPVALDDVRSWWEYVPGASWRKPGGPGTTINGRDRHPVVQVAYEDAESYAAWAGKELPTEAEWEFAARGGLERAVFAWGDEHFPDGRAMANTWQGEFPWQNLKVDGSRGDVAGRQLRAERLRPPRHDRERLGMDDRRLRAGRWGRGRAPVLRPARPQVAGAGRALPAQGDQGRLAPLRAELLPALPALGAPERDRRHLHGAHRLPLHGAAGLMYAPLQMVMLAFEGGKFEGKILAELKRLREAGIVRLAALVFVMKNPDGSLTTLQESDLEPVPALMLGNAMRSLMGTKQLPPAPRGTVETSLFGYTDADIRRIAAEIPTGTAVALALFEHLVGDGPQGGGHRRRRPRRRRRARRAIGAGRHQRRVRRPARPVFRGAALTLVAASAGEVILPLAAASALFLIWVITVGVLFTDAISISEKLLWFVALTVLAPIAIPVYLLVRLRRWRRPEAAPEA